VASEKLRGSQVSGFRFEVSDSGLISRKGAKHVLSPSAKLRINSVEEDAKFRKK
jgi:hypothetical protein